jgi:hypothetical protein
MPLYYFIMYKPSRNCLACPKENSSCYKLKHFSGLFSILCVVNLLNLASDTIRHFLNLGCGYQYRNSRNLLTTKQHI